MTRLDWGKAKRHAGWTYEMSPARPATVMDYVLAEPPRRPLTPASRSPAAITLDSLAGHGINRLAIWCATCRTAEHRPIDGLAADIRALPIAELGDVVRCEACGGSTNVSAFKEGPLRNA